MDTPLRIDNRKLIRIIGSSGTQQGGDESRFSKVSSAGNHDGLTCPRHHPGMDEHAPRRMLGHKELNMAMDALHDGLVIGRTIQNSAVDVAGGLSGIRSTVPRPSPKGVRDVTDRAPGLARSWRHD